MHLESYLSAKQASDEEIRRWRDQSDMKIMKVKMERNKSAASTKQTITNLVDDLKLT